MASHLEIHQDARCSGCGYNLRGLTLHHRCPECGMPALESIRFSITRKYNQSAESLEALWRVGAAIKAATMESGYSGHAFVFVRDVLSFARLARADEDSRSVNAVRICKALKEYAEIHFGGEDKAVVALARMKIRQSEDVGRVIFAMVDQKLLIAEAEDSLEAFAGLFTLENLYCAA
jgi:uncharacterized repeat protein (TIGR04138 family)